MKQPHDRANAFFVLVAIITAPIPSAWAVESSFSSPVGQVDYRSKPLGAALKCEQLAAKIPGVSDLVVRLMAATDTVPEHCRVDGFLPTQIGFQLNFPTAWNGRLYMYGNGGYAGEDSEAPQMQKVRGQALAAGFSTARTDTGHLASKQPGATFAQDPTAFANHAYQAVHNTIEYAKTAVAAFYGTAQKYAYWDGCSTGGREGVMSAYRFPNDFNGILAAAPTLDWTSIMIKGLWRQSATAGSGLTLAKSQTVFNAVLAKCDAQDGVKDGLIDDPRLCAFDPRRDVARCKAGDDGDTCLTQPQADALQKVYEGPPKVDGMPKWVREYPGFESTTTSANWLLRADGAPNQLSVMGDTWMKYIGFKNPTYDATTFDFVRDSARARAGDALMNPKPDLTAFQAAGGKMITYWGWTDMALNAGMGLDFYDKVVAKYGLSETQKFYRFFLVPGVAHCQGGYGPDVVDAMTPLIDWVEKGTAPERLGARKIVEGKTTLNRAYCRYPAATKYKAGDSENPANYSCVTPAK